MAVGLLAGCGGPAGGHGAAASNAASASSTTSAAAVRHVQGRVGSLLLLGDGYVPEPASPDVAAAYLTVVNTGSSPARLTAVQSDLATMTMPMTETSSGGTGSMAPLTKVVVPAHGSFRFTPGAAHLMLEHPRPVPKTGGTVTLTLTFSPGGTVTVALPVVPIGSSVR
jgi:copper(I)-binding protein